MIHVLSTRMLTEEQRGLLDPAEYDIVEYDALHIHYLPADLSSDDEALCIFTSQHAVEACFPEDSRREQMLNCCCVGAKTAALLESMGHRILDRCANAEELAARILKKYPSRSFIYFCGNRRLNTLPDLLREAGVRLEERVVYETGLNEEAFNQDFDAILFFSPSGVQSFTILNDLGDATAVCIGPTTANEAHKHTDKFIIADTPTAEGVVLAVQKLPARHL